MYPVAVSSQEGARELIMNEGAPATRDGEEAALSPPPRNDGASTGRTDPPTQRTWRLLSQHQLAALLATSLDYCVMIVLVSLCRLSPVVGTVCGALCGALTNFVLGRRWVFRVRDGRLSRQARRYALVSLVSLACNAAAEWLLVRAGLQYIGGRALASLTIGVGWNFPMHRHFVFAAKPGPER